MNKQIITLVLVVALVVFSGVQAVQINDLKDETSSGSAVSGYATSQGSAPAPQRQQAAPTMVGGC
jgi:hypothetical protein